MKIQINIRENELKTLIIDTIKKCYYNENCWVDIMGESEKNIYININTSELLNIPNRIDELPPDNFKLLIFIKGEPDDCDLIKKAEHYIWELKHWISYDDEYGSWENFNVTFK